MSVVTQDWKEIYFYSTELYLKNTPKMKEYIEVILNISITLHKQT